MPADTFRAWERRYGLPRPSRTPGNQRLYSDRDIATINWLRDQTQTGMTISQAVHLFRSSGRAGGMRPDGSIPAPTLRPWGVDRAGTGAFARLRHEIVAALTGFEASRADRAVEEALALGTVEDVCLHVLQPVLVEVGDRWERGEIPIGIEHFATAFVLRKLGALFNLSRPDAGRGPILAACPEGELHEVGLLLTCLFLSRRGFRIVYLGANLPLTDLIAAVERVRPSLVLLSTSTVEGIERLIASANALTDPAIRPSQRPTPAARLNDPGRGSRHGVPSVGYGGQVFVDDPDLRSRVPGIYLGSNADEAVAAVERIFSGER